MPDGAAADQQRSHGNVLRVCEEHERDRHTQQPDGQRRGAFPRGEEDREQNRHAGYEKQGIRLPRHQARGEQEKFHFEQNRGEEKSRQLHHDIFSKSGSQEYYQRQKLHGLFGEQEQERHAGHLYGWEEEGFGRELRGSLLIFLVEVCV